MGECVDLAFYARVIVEGIVVKVPELRGVPFKGGILEGCCNIGFHQSNVSESDEVLKTLHKEYNVFIIHILPH